MTFWKKLHILYSFFFVRKIIGHIVSFFFYCVVLPTTVFFPEVVVPTWGAIYIPMVITFLHAFSTPRYSNRTLLRSDRQKTIGK